MIISATTDYSIRIMVALAKHGKIISSTAISDQTGVPHKYLIKLANLLRKSGLVSSRQGLNGGYSLARPAEEITVWDILCSIESYNEQKSNCSMLVRFMHEDLNKIFKSHFEPITLAKLVEMEACHRGELKA